MRYQTSSELCHRFMFTSCSNNFSVCVSSHLLLFQSVVGCLWHPKLNQLMVGTGNGLVKVYYDPVKSQRCFAVRLNHDSHSSLFFRPCLFSNDPDGSKRIEPTDRNDSFMTPLVSTEGRINALHIYNTVTCLRAGHN